MCLAGFVEAVQDEAEPVVAWIAESVDGSSDRIRQWSVIDLAIR